MTDRPTFVSLFAGVGGFDLGFHRAGFACVGQCEIDPHARDVLERHFPDTPRHDDVTTLTPETFEHPDVVTFGSPCQDLSVAGKRAGLAGSQSGLFLHAVRYIRAVQEETDGARPTFALWENVPGAFSSNGGEDFAAVLALLVGGEVRNPADGWDTSGIAFGPEGSAEWRVLDSQHFGVAQRRRRVFALHHPRGERAGHVLFEPAGVPLDPSTSEEARQDVAGTLEARAGADGFPGTDGAISGHVVPTLTARYGKGPDSDLTDALVETPRSVHPLDLRSAGSEQGAGAGTKGSDIGPDGSPAYTLTTQPAARPAVAVTAPETAPIAFEPRHYTRDQAGGGPIRNRARALMGRGRGDVAQHVAFAMRGRDEGNVPEINGDGQTVSALRAAEGGSTRDLVAFAENTRAEVRLEGGDGQRTGALSAGGGKPGQGTPTVASAHAVRRLTPRECERLQGFPDDWTRYRPDGTEIANTHRYRMMGNAVTVTVAEWLARRIRKEIP